MLRTLIYHSIFQFIIDRVMSQRGVRLKLHKLHYMKIFDSIKTLII